MICRLSSIRSVPRSGVPGLTTMMAGLLALSTGLMPVSVSAQTAVNDAPGGTLGIDCEQPRRTPEGKLILGDDGSHRARCEADRATALNYALVVRETRNRIRTALSLAPQPLWDDLVTHLSSGAPVSEWGYDEIGAFRPDDPAKRDALQDVARAAEYWKTGVLDHSAVPEAWRPFVKTRTCGVDFASGRPEPQIAASVLVWLDPDNIRDRWSSQMVQRTVRAWLERQDGRFSMRDQIPDILTESRELVDANGRTRNIPTSIDLNTCLDQAPAIPTGALVMRASLTHSTDWEDITQPCTGDPEVGVKRLRWETHNGLYIVPKRAILPDGTPHPQRGKPLLEPFADPQDRPVPATGIPALSSSDYPITDAQLATFLVQSCRPPRVKDVIRTEACPATIGNTPVKGTRIQTLRLREFQDDPDDPNRVYYRPVMRDPENPENGNGVLATGDVHPMWSESVLFCTNVPDPELPSIPDPVVDTVPAPTCQQQWGSQFPEGDRTGFVQTITYPEGWGQDDVIIRTVEDDCFQAIPVQQTQRTEASCPSGQIGEITNTRLLTWFNRAWAVQDGTYPPNTRRLPNPADLGAAIAQVDTNQTDLPWYDRVSAGNWATTNTCRPRPGNSCEARGGRRECNSGGCECIGGTPPANRGRNRPEERNYSSGDRNVGGQDGRDNTGTSREGTSFP